MKINYLLSKIIILFLFISPNFLLAQLGVNSDNSAPDPSAQLDVKSSNKGLLLPRIISPNSAIASPAAGLMVYDQANANISYYNGTNWSNLTGTAVNQGLYSRFPNSLGYQSTTNIADPTYLEFTWPKPVGISQVWIEMWAAGNPGGFTPSTFHPASGNQFEGGASGDFASFILNVSSVPNITVRVGKGGYQARNGGSSSIIIGANTYAVHQAFGFLTINNVLNNPMNNLINFVSGTNGEQVTISHNEYMAGQFLTYLNGGKGADAYPNQKGGHGISGSYIQVSPWNFAAYTNYGFGNGASPGAGGGVGFTSSLNSGFGGNGLVIVHW